MTQRERHRGSVVARLALAMLAAGLLFGAAGTYVIVNREGDALRRDVHTRQLLAADEFATRIDGRVQGAIDSLRLLATGDEISSFDEQAGDELTAALRASPVFDELLLLDGAGEPVAAAASRFLADPTGYAPRPAVTTAVHRASFVAILHAFPPSVEIGVAVENPPGTVVGALLGTTPLDVLAAGVVRQPAGDHDPIRFVADEDGIIVAHSNREWVLERERFPVEVLLDRTPPARDINWDGESHLAAAARTSLFPGVVVVKHRETAALAIAEGRVRDIVEIVLVVLAASMVAIVAAGGLLLRPLRPLARAVRRIGHGERGVRAPAMGRGEIALVADEFNRMAEALDRREAQVAELRHLSLLLTSQADRSELLGEITAGARELFRADVSVFRATAADDAPLETFSGEAVDGDLREAVVEMATRSERRGALRDGSLLAVPVASVGGEAFGTLVVCREAGFDEDDLSLALALASVAGATLENVGRLELQRALAGELQRAVDQRRDLMGTVSHEFRTPLTCIEGFSSALLTRWDDSPDDERKDLVRRIHHHATELEDLVSRLLDFAVAERGSLTASLSEVDLGDAVRRVISDLGPLLDGRRVSIDVEHIRAVADPVLLKRTLSNLISNAVKYSAAGSPITVAAHATRETVRLEVTDAGVGMTTDEAEQAFRPFWRAGNATTRPARGAGLGLALVAEYVQAMGGTCGVSSAAGRGSTFFFTLAAASGTAERQAVQFGHGGRAADADADR